MYKNNSASNDYGTNVQDVNKDGTYIGLVLKATQQRAFISYDGTLSEIATLDDLNGLTKAIQITTTGGFPTTRQDIGAQWTSIPLGSGTVVVNNGYTIFHGTYYKYSNTIGSIHMTDCSTGYVYVWNCNGGNYTFNKLYSIFSLSGTTLTITTT